MDVLIINSYIKVPLTIPRMSRRDVEVRLRACDHKLNSLSQTFSKLSSVFI